MAKEEKQSGGRRIVSQAEAQAVQAKAGVDTITRSRAVKPVRERVAINRRELMAYALAGSTAVLTALGLGTMLSPNNNDELVKQLPSEGAWIPGGFAYPRVKAGEFGGKFILPRTAASYTTTEAPELNSGGKFYIVKIEGKDPTANGEVVTNDGFVGVEAEGIMAIYQVCTHLGCLIPFQQAENRFICPCHGSTFQRNSNYVLGPAPRNLDQFPVTVENGALVVDTGKKKTGKTHA
ncbi:MAG TPA: ubiquinol-cytochrome c reductase iron-sulfur subunit [Herpetosiphonaceae bacterium]